MNVYKGTHRPEQYTASHLIVGMEAIQRAYLPLNAHTPKVARPATGRGYRARGAIPICMRAQCMGRSSALTEVGQSETHPKMLKRIDQSGSIRDTS